MRNAVLDVICAAWHSIRNPAAGGTVLQYILENLMTDIAMNGTAGADSGPYDDDGFCRLRVETIRRETADAVSVIFSIPEALRTDFSYEAGQFLTLRLTIGGKSLVRSYSMSSSPHTDSEYRITVKRIDSGRVSGWIVGNLAIDDIVDVMRPAGRFCLRREDGPLVLFGAGSGITPILSIAKTALATMERPVTLIYANRDRDSTIFSAELDALAAEYPDRLELLHWFDAERGFLTQENFGTLPAIRANADYYICGPGTFMDVAEGALLRRGVDPEHIFVERFVSPPDSNEIEEASLSETSESEVCETLTVSLRGKTTEIKYTAGDTIIESMRRVGIRPPFSCLLGTCGTCIAKVTRGAVSMRINEVLHASEVDDGYVLTCQGRPTAKDVKIIYED